MPQLSALLHRLPWRRRRTIVPAIRLQGVIGRAGLGARGLTLASVDEALEKAFALPAPAVALLVDSPGGSAAQSSLIAGRVRALADKAQRPVLAFVEDVAASGGYWLATAADEIYADAASIVGSIGVVSAGFGFEKAFARLGVERRLHTSGSRKALLDPFLPEKSEDVAFLRALQEELHGLFKGQVRQRRGARLRLPEAELFDGRIWTGQGALAAGLIDGLGDATGVVRQRFGAKARLRVLNRPRGWLARRLGGASGTETDRLGPGTFAADLLALAEERVYYGRLGL